MSNLSLWIYRLLGFGALPLAIPAIWLKDRLRDKARPSFRSRLRWNSFGVPRKPLWIQAVSVGEVEVARRLLAELAKASPELRCLLTATTATGLALAERTVADRATIRPCPLDLPFPLARLFREVSPRTLVLVETELWPEMLHQAGRRNVPVAIANARLSESSLRGYRRVGRLLRPLLEPVSLVAARSEADAERFSELGVPASSIQVTGNIKYDLEPGREPLPWAQDVQALAAGRPIVVAGSTMDGEEEVVLDAVATLAALDEELFLVIAPRHPERFDAVAELLETRGLSTQRRSQPLHGGKGTQVFLLDTIGELGRAYALARAAFIGGSLVPTGGHNPLEPAVFGVPVLTGPHVFNFTEVYDEMVAAGGAVVVQHSDSLARVLSSWLNEPELGVRAGTAARRVVEANRGATARTIAALLALLGEGRRGD